MVFIAAQSGASMMPATDGSLIVRIERSSAGMITIVPFASTSHRYARFLRIVPVPPAEAKPRDSGALERNKNRGRKEPQGAHHPMPRAPLRGKNALADG